MAASSNPTAASCISELTLPTLNGQLIGDLSDGCFRV
jgi:hypothetical protein